MKRFCALAACAAALAVSGCVTDGGAPGQAAALRPVPDVGDGALPAVITRGAPDAEGYVPRAETSGAREPAEQPASTPQPVPSPAADGGTAAQIAAAINAWRAEHGLPAVPVSQSLTRVARAHAADLAQARPDTGACTMHSWSDQGAWTPVCYTEDHARAAAMWSKPAELTAYPGRGFEIAWRTSLGFVTPGAAVAGWRGSPRHNNVLLQRGPWEDTQWRAMGVGVEGGYAVVWFGRYLDPAG